MKKNRMQHTLWLVAAMTLSLSACGDRDKGATGMTEAPSAMEKSTDRDGEMGTEMKEGSSETDDGMMDKAGDAMDSTKEGMSDAYDATKEGASKAYEATKETAGEIADAARKKMDDVSESTE